jgi:hypothetical protein
MVTPVCKFIEFIAIIPTRSAIRNLEVRLMVIYLYVTSIIPIFIIIIIIGINPYSISSFSNMPGIGVAVVFFCCLSNIRDFITVKT